MKAFRKLKVGKMNIDSHLFQDTLEQMKELLSSPDIVSRADDPILTKTIVEFYELIDEYAVEQNSDVSIPEVSDKIQAILAQLASKIDAIDQHVNLNLNKLSFLSKVTPKD